MRLESNGIPQHQQLYDILKSRIVDGVYKPGDFLPSEHALCATYDVTRPTVRQALNSLVAEGLIKKQRGKGSIVQRKKTGIGILSIKGTTDTLPEGILETRVIDSPTVGPWKLDFDFEVSREEYESGCIRMSRLRLVHGDPVLFEITNLPNINLPRFCSRSFENRSLFNILRTHYNLQVTGGEQKIRAIRASGQVCSLLKVKRGVPVLQLQKKYETNRPYYHFYTSIWSVTDEYYLQGRF